MLQITMIGELTPGHKLLLSLALSRGQVMPNGKVKNAMLMIEDAYSLYPSKYAAREAVMTLIYLKYLEQTDVPGRFRVISAPEECFKNAESMRERMKNNRRAI